jgi:hypothetical protein
MAAKEAVDELLIAEAAKFHSRRQIGARIVVAVHIEIAASVPPERAIHVERTSRLERHDNVQLPSSQHLVGHAF